MWCMNTTKRTERPPADADLGMALLIAETVDSHYEPIGPVATINEAREIAADDMRGRMRRLEKGGAPACPESYKIWSRDDQGQYAVICQLDAATLIEVE